MDKLYKKWKIRRCQCRRRWQTAFDSASTCQRNIARKQPHPCVDEEEDPRLCLPEWKSMTLSVCTWRKSAAWAFVERRGRSQFGFAHQRRRSRSKTAIGWGQLASGCFHRETLCRSGHAVPGFDSGRQYGTDEGCQHDEQDNYFGFVKPSPVPSPTKPERSVSLCIWLKRSINWFGRQLLVTWARTDLKKSAPRWLLPTKKRSWIQPGACFEITWGRRWSSFGRLH